MGLTLRAVILCALTFTSARAQNNVGIGTTTPDASAVLDLTSTSQGLLVPRMTNTQMLSVSSPATGLLVYNTTNSNFYYYTGSAWSPFLAAATGWNITGNAGISAATNFLGTTDANPLAIRTNNTERMRVLATGEVGIGITAPTAKLQIGDGNVSLTNTTNSAGEVRLYEPSGSGTNYSAIRVRAQAADITYTLPAAAPTAGQVLTAGATPTDLDWTTISTTSLWTVGVGTGSLIGAGTGNTANGNYAIVAGQTNAASGLNSVAIGGLSNQASGSYSTVSGGQGSVASGLNSVVGGGYTNQASGSYSNVAGGQNNIASGTNAFVGGGNANTANGFFTVIDGGQSNSVGSSVQHGAIVGGQSNSMSGVILRPFIGGGLSNAVSASYGSILGGESNAVSAQYGTVLGGKLNSANGDWSLVGGYNNTASSAAQYSFVFGYGANVTQSNTVVFHHSSGNATRVGIRNVAPTEALDVTGNIRLSGALMPNNLAGTAGQVLVSTGANSAPTWSNLSTVGWGLTGNSGTTAGTNFLGTTDSVSVVLKTNNTERVRIMAAGNVGIGTSSPTNKLEVTGGDIALTNTNNTAGKMRFLEPSSSGSNYTEFKARAQAGDISYTWPDTAGQANDVLTTDGSGNLYWSNNLLTGSLYLGGTTSATLSGNTNNFALDANYTLHRISSTGSVNITGFAGGSDGRVIILINVGNSVISLKYQDANSSAANRIVGSGGGLNMQADQAVSLVYDGIAQRWRIYAAYP